jgi:hypothetical protein
METRRTESAIDIKEADSVFERTLGEIREEFGHLCWSERVVGAQ